MAGKASENLSTAAMQCSHSVTTASTRTLGNPSFIYDLAFLTLKVRYLALKVKLKQQLSTGKTSPGALHPVPESSARQRCGPVGAGPQEATNTMQGRNRSAGRTGERVGELEPEGKAAPGRP